LRVSRCSAHRGLSFEARGAPWRPRRRWDLNPRLLSQHTISNRADSAALARLLDSSPVRLVETRLPHLGLSCLVAPLLFWARWPGPAQRPLVNRVRVGRQQLSAGMAGCRSQPGHRARHRSGCASGARDSMGRGSPVCIRTGPFRPSPVSPAWCRSSTRVTVVRTVCQRGMNSCADAGLFLASWSVPPQAVR
jgi:hypothetical protein